MIVESPAKAHTIQKYLGPDYEVMASMGHVRDLPASRLSVDVKNDFAPNYENIKGKGELIKKLRAEAKKSDYVYLATDPDREGEAISWHLAQLLKLDETEPNRVTFNEITKSGIKYGMEHPRCIDQQLVDAQQARRVLDRIVGYEISPFLWKKIRKGLSAGRVQSVAVRLVVDREDEIRAFKPEEYWTLEALLQKQGVKAKPFLAKYYGTGGKKCEITTEEQANALKAAAEKEPFILPIEKVFSTYPAVTVSAAQAVRFRNGGALAAERLHTKLPQVPVRVFAPDGVFLGLGQEKEQSLAVLKLFV